MVQWYRRANSRWSKILWWLVIGCMLLSLPLAADRYRTENSSKQVEFVFDYRDLLEISDYKTNPRAFVEDQLKEMKQAGIRTLAVYESTLNELKLSRRIEVYNSHEAAALNQTTPSTTENATYVLFTDKEAQSTVQDMIERGFRAWNVKIRPWSYKNTPGIILEMPIDEASMKPLSPDPIAMKQLKDKGFDILGRLGNRKPSFDPAEMEATLQLLKQYGVRTILADGDSVPGYSANPKETKENLQVMATLLNKYDMALAAVELQKVPQKGFNTLAKEMDYNAIRLHSFTEQDASKLTENVTNAELEGRIQEASDRFVLAVKDRNIRLVLLNARAGKNVDRGVYADPLQALYKSLKGPDGAVKRLQQSGFALGPAHSFHAERASLKHWFKPFALLGSTALIVLTISCFFPWSSLLLTIAGIGGTGILYKLSPNATEKLLALGVGICASSLGLIIAMRWVRRQASLQPDRQAWWKAPAALFIVTAISGIGIAYVVGLLNDITYNLLIDQFKGVKILAYMPVMMTALYLVFFSEELTGIQRVAKARTMLNATISVLWVVAVGVIGAVGIYYLSRTGNEGTASSAELVFRSFLENTLGVRPRTKEFLIAHPLLILGTYLCLRRKISGLWLMLIGSIGQASVVGTFTHLHTPLYISFIRVTLGVAFGALIGIALIIAWEIASRGWNKWAGPLRS